MAAVIQSNFAICARQIGSIPAAARAAVARALKRGLEYARSISQREFLQGPRPRKLGEVTTRLRQSIWTKVESDDQGISGHIGTNVSYGAFHEFGFYGVQNVRAHQRVVKHGAHSSDIMKARGPVRDNERRVVGYKHSLGYAARKVAPLGTIQYATVRAHTRRLNYHGRPFVNPALAKAEPRMIQEIRHAVSDTLSAAGGTPPVS